MYYVQDKAANLTRCQAIQFLFFFTDKDPKSTGACTVKLFTDVIYGILQYARVFVPGKPFQPSQMFAGKAGA
jgi:hypothetical protein